MSTYKGKYVFNFFKASPKEIQDKLQGLVQKIIKLLIEVNGQELNVLFEECKPARYSAQGYLEESQISEETKRALVNVGYVYGMLDVMQLYLKELNVQSEIQQINTKYRDGVLKVLSKRGTMLHGDLANAIGVSASGLNAVIKKMNGTSVKLVRVEEVSKYKLYSVTPIAYSYVIANNPEIAIEYEVLNDLKGSERLMKYLVEINRMINERKISENTVRIFEGRDKTKFGNDKKYMRREQNIVYTDKFVKRLAQ